MNQLKRCIEPTPEQSLTSALINQIYEYNLWNRLFPFVLVYYHNIHYVINIIYILYYTYTLYTLYIHYICTIHIYYIYTYIVSQMRRWTVVRFNVNQMRFQCLSIQSETLYGNYRWPHFPSVWLRPKNRN